MSKSYRESRNARIIELLRTNLEADFKPMPQSNRQFENLTTALNKVGPEKMAEVWAMALANGEGKPDSIIKALDRIIGTVEIVCGETVESDRGGRGESVEAAPHLNCGDGVENAVEHATKTVETQPTMVEGSTVVAIPLESLQVGQLPRKLKLECALIVLSQFNVVHKAAMESRDSVFMEIYRDVLKSVLDLVDKRGELCDAKNAISRALEDLLYS